MTARPPAFRRRRGPRRCRRGPRRRRLAGSPRRRGPGAAVAAATGRAPVAGRPARRGSRRPSSAGGAGCAPAPAAPRPAWRRSARRAARPAGVRPNPPCRSGSPPGAAGPARGAGWRAPRRPGRSPARQCRPAPAAGRAAVPAATARAPGPEAARAARARLPKVPWAGRSRAGCRCRARRRTRAGRDSIPPATGCGTLRAGAWRGWAGPAGPVRGGWWRTTTQGCFIPVLSATLREGLPAGTGRPVPPPPHSSAGGVPSSNRSGQDANQPE